MKETPKNKIIFIQTEVKKPTKKHKNRRTCNIISHMLPNTK